MSKWKSVKNLPEDQSNVLVIWDCTYTIWWYQPGNKKWIIYSNQWFIETKDVITHWRKLPKLPKE